MPWLEYVAGRFSSRRRPAAASCALSVCPFGRVLRRSVSLSLLFFSLSSCLSLFPVYPSVLSSPLPCPAANTKTIFESFHLLTSYRATPFLNCKSLAVLHFWIVAPQSTATGFSLVALTIVTIAQRKPF